MSSRSTWIGLGTALGVTGLAGGALLYSRRASAASSAVPAVGSGTGAPAGSEFLPLPTAADVQGDLTRNWGETPFDLRALFLLMEEASRIKGSGRLFSGIAYRESRFVTTAHNGNAAGEQDERAGAPTRTTRIATRRWPSASRRRSSAAAACSVRSPPTSCGRACRRSVPRRRC